MKREILFRGKRKLNGDWIYGDLYTGLNNELYINAVVELTASSRYNKQLMIQKETVGQFTGLTDKNGTKIFEGDKLDNGFIVEWREFNNCGCCYDVKGVGFDFEDRYFDGKNHEVIGNIHDKPKENANKQ